MSASKSSAARSGGVIARLLASAETAMKTSPMEALTSVKAAIDLATAARRLSDLGRALVLSSQCLRNLGRLTEAEADLDRALVAFESGGQRSRLGHVYLLQSMLFLAQDRISLALAAAVRALGYPDLVAKDRAFALGTIAFCFGHLVGLEQAREVLELQALPEADRSADPRTIVECYTRAAGLMYVYSLWSDGIDHADTCELEVPAELLSGNVYVAKGLDYADIAKLHWSLVSPVERSTSMAQTACLVARQRGWPAAEVLFQDAIEQVRNGFPRAYMTVLRTAGMAARVAGRWDAARRLLLEAARLPGAEVARNLRLTSYELSCVYRGLGDAERTVVQLKTFARLERVKSRIAISWVSAPADRKRYGEQPDLGAVIQAVEELRKPTVLMRSEDYIERNLRSKPTLAEIAKAAGTSARSLQRLYRARSAMPVSEFVRERRMQRAYDLLVRSQARVKDAAEAIGYSSMANFSRDFRKRFGESPSTVLRRSGSVHRPG